jgi:hypothetical protein
VFGRSKWDCKGYAGQNKYFVKGASNGTVEFGYSGQRTESVRTGIRTSDVQWIMERLGRISDDQLRDALVAAGASSDEASCYASAVRGRLDRLKAAAEGR